MRSRAFRSLIHLTTFAAIIGGALSLGGCVVEPAGGYGYGYGYEAPPVVVAPYFYGGGGWGHEHGWGHGGGWRH